MTAVSEFGTDVLLVFVGHAEDAVAESKAIKSLEHEFQRLLDQRIEVMREPPFSRVKVWEWEDDAKAAPVGQAGLIAPYLERAQMAIFVFRQRIGSVTWQELEQFRKQPNAKPAIVVFCDDPIDEGLHDIDVIKEWLDLLEKKRDLTRGWTDPASRPVRPFDNYKDLDHLRSILLDQFSLNLGPVLRAAQTEPPGSQLAEARALRAPSYSGHIERAALSAEIHAAVESASIVAVEGLPNSGKSSASALYLRGAKGAALFKSVLWYAAQRGDTLNDFLAVFESEFKTLRLTGKSPGTQCRQVMAFLNDQSAVLVVDDIHLAEQSTFDPLLRAAVMEGTPARIIVVSGEIIRSDEAFTGISHVRCAGFDPIDMERFLAAQGVKPLGDDFARVLLQKTGGLPFAISMFCALIKSSQHAPDDLLGGSQEIFERLESWFSRVVSMVDVDDYRLLQGLSAVEEPFGLALAEAVSASRGVAGAATALKRLERSCLIQRQNVDLWKVHQFVADFAVTALDAKERSLVHEAIARQHCTGITLASGSELTDEEFFALERSCKHYQRAGNTSEAAVVLRAISKTAKDRGFYEKLKRLCSRQIELEENKVTWRTYDYMHCCLITGEITQAWSVLDALFAKLPTVDADLRIQLARLYAEVSSALGRHEQGLHALSSIVATVDVTQLNETVRFQLRSCEIQLLTRLRRYDDAQKLCQLYLAEAKLKNNSRNMAIGLTNLGILDYCHHRYDSARINLDEAVRLFREIKGTRGEPRDRRGLSWALLYLSPCLLECGERDAAQSTLLEAILIRREIDESSIETRDMLEALAARPYAQDVQVTIRAEIGRLTERLGGSGQGDAANKEVVLPEPCLVVLVGVSGAGKTTFARRHFNSSEVVSSDRCRELICDDPDDQTATGYAFDILNTIATKRLAFGRLTVIDATSVQAKHRASLIELARTHHVPAIAIVLDLSEQLCLQRNNARSRVVPKDVVLRQIASLHLSGEGLPSEGFDRVYVFKTPEAIDAVRLKRVPKASLNSPSR
jgi:predicted kinase